MPIFAIGLAYALNSMRGFFKIFIVLLLLAAITWNILLLTQVSFNHTLIDPNVPYGTLTRNQFTIAPELFKKLVESRF